ncbi:MAG: FAD-binding oxidoreductase [Candidatus Helarchaeota archaeon]|nr:FAD-binding oxidoreductase [Candidatus Helarchaeota archaeon]
MELDDNIFNEFVKIVGEKHASKDPVITQAYGFNWCNELVNVRKGKEASMFVDAPIAVLLPRSTEEVQKILKLINEVGLKFKAQSTGLGPWNCVSSEDVVILDLRRMDKIRKIDEKNMYCVVEPYVIGSTLQAELIKLNLNCHMPGAGPQVSPLASATSMAGPGFTSNFTGHSERNVLGVEWILPNGELLNVGSLGLETRSDWFCGDGPGFSLRGIMRGPAGAKSGIGVFTAVAIKLYPYPVEPKWKLSGISPNYEFEIPNYMELHFISYPDWDSLEHALNRFSEEEVGYHAYFTSNLAIGAVLSNSVDNLFQMASSTARLKKPLILLICAKTKREFEYKKKVLAALLEETKGKDFSAKGKIVPTSLTYVEALRSALGFHAFLITGAFQSTFGGMDTIGLAFQMVKSNITLKKEYIEKKLLPNDQGEGAWCQGYEHGHYAHMEAPTLYIPSNPDSRKGMVEYSTRADDVALEENLNVPFFIEGDEMHDLWGAHLCNHNIWLRKIKEAFDPNNTADSGFYISTSKEIKKKIINEI